MRLDAVESGAYLTPEVIGSQAERLSRGLELKLNLAFAAAVVVADIVEALIGGEFNFNGFSNFAELFEIAS